MTITRDDPRFWDVRTLERRLRKGQINKKDIEKHLKGLPDVEEKKATISAADSLDDVDDDDFDDVEDELDAADEGDDEDDELDAAADDGGDAGAGGDAGPDSE
jgi:hypothetical protein